MVEVPNLVISRLFVSGPLPMFSIISQFPTAPVNYMTVTIVKPPFVAMLKVRDPASRFCDLLRSKLTCPFPFGPPRALYVGTVPIAALVRVDIDANEGLGVSAINLTQEVVEYDAITFVLDMLDLLQTPPPVVHDVIFCGLLFHPQQSCTVVVTDSDLNPAGHAWHATDPLAF